MAAVAHSADQATELLQKLSLESQAKTVEIQDATKKPPADLGIAGNGYQTDRSVTPILPDFVDQAYYVHPSLYQYYYGGCDGNAIDWDEYTRYSNPDGVEIPTGVYGENGSFMVPAYGYPSYAPYSPAGSPVPTHDGHLYGAQHYQYPLPYFQSTTQTNASYPTVGAPAKGHGAKDQQPLAGVDATSNSNGIVNDSGTKGTNGAGAPYNNSSFNSNGSYATASFPGGFLASGYQDPRFAFDGLHSPIPWIESPFLSDGQQGLATASAKTSSATNGNKVNSSRNQNNRPQLLGLHQPMPMSVINTASGYYNRMYPKKLYGQYGNGYRSSVGYGSAGSENRGNGQNRMYFDSKYKPRGRGNNFCGYGNENIDGLSELNRGPRAKSTKNPKAFSPVGLPVEGQNIPLTPSSDNDEKPILTPDREQFNGLDFPETYADAKFYIIKSYSEDDVHKSIKYSVWASTPSGNKKLDAAYGEAKEMPGACPIFLFFSVNTSGQFVGVAEMVGHVDFDKKVEYWQQDKWIGCFPVKWHIVKDVPNSLFKHVILENNENKPVTNSRDTQEVKMDQGLQILKIFKDHNSKQCILDDFDFYEDRQKRIQEKKARALQYQKQGYVWESKSDEKQKREVPNAVDVKSQKPKTEMASVLKEVNQINGDAKIFETIPEAKIVSNDVANVFLHNTCSAKGSP